MSKCMQVDFTYLTITLDMYPPPCLRHQWSVHRARTIRDRDRVPVLVVVVVLV